MAVEMMFSMSYLFRFHGISDYADKVERPAFNALPAALTPDCKFELVERVRFSKAII